MSYLEGIETNDPTEADDALVLGTAVHTGIEKDLETAIKEYSFSYPIITDEHINEIIKLKNVIPKAKVVNLKLKFWIMIFTGLLIILYP